MVVTPNSCALETIVLHEVTTEKPRESRLMKYVDVRFTFEVDQEILEEEGEVCLDLASIQRLDGNLSKEEGRDVVEILAQSDRYWTEYAWKILDCIEDGK